MDGALLGMLGGAYVLVVGLAWQSNVRISNRLDQLSDAMGAMRVEIATVRADLGAEIAAVRTHLGDEIASVRTEIASVRTEIAGVRTEIADLRGELRAHAADRTAH